MLNSLTKLIFLTMALMTVATLAGCANGFPGARPLTYATAGEARLYASFDKCPNDPNPTQEIAPVAAAILTSVASQLLTNFGTALTNGATGGALPSSTSSLNMSLEPSGIPRCIVIMRGEFDDNFFADVPSEDEDPSTYQTKLEEKKVSINSDISHLLGVDSTEINDELNAFHFDKIINIDHLIEIKMILPKNSKAYTFVPIFTRINRSIDGDKSGVRDISIKLEFKNPSLQGATYGSIVVIGNRKIGENLNTIGWNPETKQYPHQAPWFGMDIKKDETKKDKTNQKNTESKKPTVFSDADNATPMTLTATVVETRPSNEGLAFIASVFGGVKSTLNEEVQQIIDPSLNDAAKAAAELAESDFYSAKSDAETAKVTYCTNGNSNANNEAGDSMVRAKQLKANSLAIKAKITTPPYKENSLGCPTT